jgi:8-amino-7-oxononanoate synthase
MGEILRQFARPYIYTTAMPPAVAWATLTSVQLARSEDGPRARLGRNIQCFKALAAELQLPIMPSDTAIQPLVIGDDEACVACGQFLQQRGFWVGTIRPPTVPSGTARLRITLNAGHQQQDIEQLVIVIRQWLKQNRPELLDATRTEAKTVDESPS